MPPGNKLAAFSFSKRLTLASWKMQNILQDTLTLCRLFKNTVNVNKHGLLTLVTEDFFFL